MSEHQIQSAFVHWCRLNETKYPALLLAFSVPNAAKRSMALAAIMRAEGLRSGVLDWWLPVPRRTFSGLAIEFKKPGAKMTAAQHEYADRLISEGWLAVVMTDWEKAAHLVEEYLWRK